MRKTFLLLLLGIAATKLSAQCDLIDGQGNDSPNPVWVSCTGGAFTLFVQSNSTFGAYSIDWGDGSAVTTGTALVPPNFVTHTYAATIDTFNLTFTSGGCTINGLVVMEEPVNASIQIPIGGVTQICAPGDLQFTNSSTDVSGTTTFIWDFGDGSPPQVFGPGNLGQTVTHTYQQGTVDCVTQVTLTAENFCSFGNPTVASFNPVQIFDLDDAQIAASAVLLCYPDTVVHFDNVTNRNCVPQGNVQQRYEYWNFGNHWGTGQDSIIDWLPFAPPNRPGYDIAFPGIGTYTIMMVDSNMCGQDTAFITIDIVPPPTAAVAANQDTICAGENVTFSNLSGAGANQFFWNFGDGSGWQAAGGGNQTHTFNVTGDVTILLVANIAGGTASCTDTASVDIFVQPSPQAGINIANGTGCDTVTTIFTDASFSAIGWNWTFGNGNTSTLQNPPAQFYPNPGNYNVALTVTGNNGCTNTDTETVTVYESPIADFSPFNVCEDALSTFFDQSTFPPGDPVISWDWDFGDGGTSNQQNPNHQFTDSGSFQVVLNVATANCPATDTFVVTVEPAPEAGFTVDSTAGCSPVFLAFTNTSVGAVNYFWDFGDGTTSTAVAPTHVFNNTGLNDTTYIVELIAETAFGCRDTVYDTVSVFPIPSAGFTSDAVLDCSPLIVNFTDNSVGALSYQWDFGDSTGSNVPNPTHVFNNQTLFITNYNVSLVVISNNGCPDTATQQITVFPEPIFGFSTAPDSGCSPLVVTFPSVIGAVTYDWDFGDGGTASGPTPTHTFVNGTVNNAVFPVTLIATSSFGCSDTTVENVTVHPNPVAQITPSTNAGCHPLQVDFQNTSTGGLNFFWDFGDGDTTTSDSALVTHTYTNTTTDTLFHTAQLIVETDRGCRDTVETDIEVYPQVIAAFDSDTIGCHPLTITFNDNSIEAAVYLWDFGDGTTSSMASPTHTFMNNTANTVVYTTKLLVTSTEGCQDSLTQNIVVFPKPTAAFILSDTVDCHAFTVDIQNTSQLNVANFWDFGDGDTSQTAAVNLSHTYDNTGAASLFHTLRLEVVSVDGCRDTLTQQMEVYPEVIASFASDTIGCHPLNISFSDSSKQASLYQWDFGDGSPVDTNASPTHIFQNNGLTTVVYTTELIVTSSDGCADTTSQNITVFPKPTAAFAVSDTVGCQPLTVDITNNSVLNIANAWDFGDGDTSQTAAVNLSHTYSNLGAAPIFRTLTLEVVSIDGCRDTAERVIEVYPQIVADFGLPATGCSPLALQLSDSSINANTYQWDFGDGTPGSGLAEPFHVFQNPLNTDTTYTVTLIVTSVEGCMDTLTQDIVVYPKPLASFNLAPDPVCHEEPVTFTNNSVNNDLNFWNFGGGLVTNNAPVFDTTFTNTSGNTVNTVIALTVETVNGCRDTVTQPLTIFPQVTAAFTMPDSACDPFTVQLFNLSEGEQTYNWDFGDGGFDVVENPIHTFQNTGVVDVTYTVTLVVTSVFGCTDTARADIVIHPSPDVNMLVTPTNQVFPAATIGLTNLTGVGPWQYAWDFGDSTTSTQQNPAPHTYGTWGEYTVTLVATSDFCTDTATQLVVIEPPLPVASFTGEQDGCRPVTIDFDNTSQFGVSYFWDFGDGGTSTQVSPSYTYFNPGTYTVRLTVTGPGGDVDQIVKQNAVVVHQNAFAFFTFGPEQVVIPTQAVRFFNFSTFADQYLWDFGDGNITTEENPEYFYQQEGEYIVSLIANNINNCPDTFTATAPVIAQVEGTIAVPNAFTPDPTGSNGGMFDPNSLTNTVFFPVMSGVLEEGYHLMIFNRWGELIFETFDIRQGWDGYYKGQISQQDVYVWKLTARLANGSEVTRVGDLTLLR